MPLPRQTGMLRSYGLRALQIAWMMILAFGLLAPLVAEPVTECDRLASDPWDLQKVTKGVPDEKVEVEAALKACEECIEEEPEELRLLHQAGRVLRLHLERQYRLTGRKPQYPNKQEREIIAGLKKAAEAGYAPAQFEFAYFCRSRFGVTGDDKSYTRAYDYYRKSAEQGYAPAQRHLGFRYSYGYTSGLTGKVDYEKALHWLSLAAKQGHPQALTELGRILDDNELYDNEGAPEDFRQAAVCYSQASVLGHLGAKTCLGNLYLTGRGVGRDCDEAAALFTEVVEWCRENRTAEVDARTPESLLWANSQSLQRLGTIYMMGCGVERDKKKAASYIEKAAESAPNITAQAQIGYLYLEGRGVEQDPEAAFEWLSLAARNGHECAALDAAALTAAGYGTARNPSWALTKLNELQSGTNSPNIRRAARALAQKIRRENPQARDWFGTKRDDSSRAFNQIILGIFVMGILYDDGGTTRAYLEGDGSQPYDNAIHMDNSTEIIHEAQMLNLMD